MIISVKEIKKYIFSVLIPLLIGYLSNILAKIISGVDTTTYYHELIKSIQIIDRKILKYKMINTPVIIFELLKLPKLQANK